MDTDSSTHDLVELRERVLRAEKLAEHLISEMDIYHAHKETMAHSALLVMIALFGTVLTLKELPTWVQPLSIVVPANGQHFSAYSCYGPFCMSTYDGSYAIGALLRSHRLELSAHCQNGQPDNRRRII